MSTDREVTRIVRSWLEEGATALPDRVLDAVLDQVPATRQRPAWWPARRLPHVNTQMRIAVALAAAVVVAVIGINLISRPGGLGGVGTPPSPTPSPSPAPTLPPSGQVPSGTYRTGFVTYTLPAGWTASGGVTIFKGNADPPNGMAVDQWQDIATVYSDPCHSQSMGVVTVASGIDALVAALVAQNRGPKVTPTTVTIDGYQGKQVDLVVPLSMTTAAIAACEGGKYTAWTDSSGGNRYNQGPGQHDLLDVFEVNGKTWAIDRVFYPANTAADRAELQAIVDSIRITP